MAGALTSPPRLDFLGENKMNNKNSNSIALRGHNKQLYIILIGSPKAGWQGF